MLSVEGADALAAGMGNAAQVVVQLQESPEHLDAELPVAGQGTTSLYDPAAQIEELFEGLTEDDTADPDALADAFSAQEGTTAEVVGETSDSVTLATRHEGTFEGVAPVHLTAESTGAESVDIGGDLSVTGSWHLDLRITALKDAGPDAYRIDPAESGLTVTLTAFNPAVLTGVMDGQEARVEPGGVNLSATLRISFADPDGSGWIEASEWTDTQVALLAVRTLEGHASMTVELTDALHAPNGPPRTLLIEWAELSEIAPTSRTPVSSDDSGVFLFSQEDPELHTCDDPVVNGTVTSSADGSPLADIRVAAYHVEDPWTPVAEGVSGADGTYSIDWPGGGEFIIHFEDPSGGHFDAWYGNHPHRLGGTVLALDAGSITYGIDIALEPAGRITGTATDGQTGLPLAGVMVEARQFDDWHGEWMPVGSTTTDAAGDYSLGGLAGADTQVVFLGGGVERATVTVEGVAVVEGTVVTGIDATLGPDAAVLGTVTDPDGTPVEGVRVIARPEDSSWMEAASAVTAADGTYRIGGLPDGSYRIEFQYGAVRTWYGAASFWDATVVAPTAAAPVSGVDVQFDRGGSVSGRVTTPEGIGVPGMTVELRPAEDEWTTLASVATDASGHFQVNGVAVGDYKVRVDGGPEGSFVAWHGGATFAAASVVTVAAGEAVSGKDVDLVRGGIVAGRVTSSSDGSGAASIDVNIDGVDVTHGDWVQTDLRGFYVSNALPAGNYGIQFWPGWSDPKGHIGAPYPEVVAVVTGQTTRADIELQVRGAVTGRVVDPDGNPLEFVTVRAYSLDSGGSWWDDWTDTMADGVFRLRRIPVDVDEVKIEIAWPPQGFLPTWYEDAASFEDATVVTLIFGEDTDLGDIVLARAGTISGTVRDADGAAIGGVTARLYQADGSWTWTSSTTAADGTYTLYLDGAGDYKVGFSAGSVGYLGTFYNQKSSVGEADLIPVALGEEVTGIDATLDRMAWVTGTVTDAATGLGLAGVAVGLRAPTAWWDSASATTNAEGIYTVYVDVAAPTEMVLRFDHPDFFVQWHDGQPEQAMADPLVVGPGEIHAGFDAALVRGASITGRVDGDGAAVDGATVTLFDAADPSTALATTTTLWTGDYAFRRLQPGDYILRFEHAQFLTEWFDDAETAAGATVLTLAAAQTAVADAVLVRGARIEGRVTSGPADTPLGGVTVTVFDDDGVQIRSTTSSWDDGTYRIEGLRAGAYFVRFARSGYLTEWYEGAADPASATPVGVTPPDATPGIDHRLRAADLTVTDFIAPDTVALGQTVEMSWTVTNIGDAPATFTWWDIVYLSTQTSNYTWFGSQIASRSSAAVIPLGPGEDYTVVLSAAIPASIGTGTRYFILRTDFNNQQPESDTGNNLATLTVTVGAPDLTVTAATAPAAASGGQTIDVSWTVENIGADPALATWWDYVYLSEDATLDAGDTALAWASSAPHVPLASGASYTMEATVTVPGAASGNQFLLFVTDRFNAQGETDVTNNLLALPISLNAPDLEISNVEAPA